MTARALLVLSVLTVACGDARPPPPARPGAAGGSEAADGSVDAGASGGSGAGGAIGTGGSSGGGEEGRSPTDDGGDPAGGSGGTGGRGAGGASPGGREAGIDDASDPRPDVVDGGEDASAAADADASDGDQSDASPGDGQADAALDADAAEPVDPCPGLSLCGGACVDTSTEDAHCGACDAPCSAGTACVGGACTRAPCGRRAAFKEVARLPVGHAPGRLNLGRLESDTTRDVWLGTAGGAWRAVLQPVPPYLGGLELLATGDTLSAVPADLGRGQEEDLVQDTTTDLILHRTSGAGSLAEVSRAEVGRHVGDLFVRDLDGNGNLEAVQAALVVEDDLLEISVRDISDPRDPVLLSSTLLVLGWSPSLAGAALGDLHGDGHQDLVLSVMSGSGPALVIVPGAGGELGMPEFVSVDERVRALVVAEVDADGRDDAVVVLGGHLRVFRGRASGSPPPPGDRVDLRGVGPVRAAQAIDVDGDGRLDLVLAERSAGQNRLVVAWGDGAGGFSVGSVDSTATVPVSSLRVVDVDDDGASDLVLVSESDSSVGVLRNTCRAPDAG